jgi:hypothetical protein
MSSPLVLSAIVLGPSAFTRLNALEVKLTTSPFEPWLLSGSVSFLLVGKSAAHTTKADISTPCKTAAQLTLNPVNNHSINP